MPETMSPREKVARCIIGPRNPVPDSSKFTLDQLRQVKWDAASEAEKSDALWSADAILAALASSGDHAELIASLRKPEIWQSYPGPEGDFEVRLAPFDAADVIEALIAEVAALRGEVSQANANGASHWSRATEAERKLDEAVGLLENMVRWADDPSDDACGMAREIEWVEASRTFLSKEAERG